MIKEKSPIKTIILFSILISFLSLLLSLIGFEAGQTFIVGKDLETSLITVQNVFSINGLRFILGNCLTNFQILEVIPLLIISLITITVLNYTGLLEELAKRLKNIKSYYLTFLILILSMIFSFFGNYSYLFLVPFIGLLYKRMGKNPLIGIITVFLGLTSSYAVGLLFNYNDHLLGLLTEKAARVEVDPNYNFKLMSTYYIFISSAFILNIVITYCVEKIISPKFKNEVVEHKQKNKILIPLIIFIIIGLFLGTLAQVALIDKEGTSYLVRLFSDNSSFKESFPLLLLLNVYITGIAFKKINKINETNFYEQLKLNFNSFSYVFILMFFLSQLIAIINWTNIGNVLAVQMVNIISNIQFWGIPLIITLFIMTIIISVFIPDLISKWLIMSPLIIPLFMRSNITPDFTQFIFKAADGIGKLISPTFIYFITTLGFLQVFDSNKLYSLFGTYKILIKPIFIIIILWLIIILGWYIIGIPIGPFSQATL